MSFKWLFEHLWKFWSLYSIVAHFHGYQVSTGENNIDYPKANRGLSLSVWPALATLSKGKYALTTTSWSCPVGLITWWRHQMETFSALLAICAGNSQVSGEFPAQRPVTRSFDVFFDQRPNKRLWGWQFDSETHSSPLWRHSNEQDGCDYWTTHALKLLKHKRKYRQLTIFSSPIATRVDIIIWSHELTSYWCYLNGTISHACPSEEISVSQLIMHFSVVVQNLPHSNLIDLATVRNQFQYHQSSIAYIISLSLGCHFATMRMVSGSCMLCNRPLPPKKKKQTKQKQTQTPKNKQQQQQKTNNQTKKEKNKKNTDKGPVTWA